MRKGIKILGKVLSAAVLLLIILPLALSLLLDIPAVQNYVVQKAVRMASKKLETTVSIDRVDIGLFSRVMWERESSCCWVGTFGTESAVRKRGGSRNLPYLNAKPRQIPLLGTYA